MQCRSVFCENIESIIHVVRRFEVPEFGEGFWRAQRGRKEGRSHSMCLTAFEAQLGLR